jgi:hypothetical protein
MINPSRVRFFFLLFIIITSTAHASRDSEVRNLSKTVKSFHDHISDTRATNATKAAIESSYDDFPTAYDTLAIALIESELKCKPNKVTKANGCMQIIRSHWRKLPPETFNSVKGNIKGGSSILREYYIELGSKSAAIQAYRVGISNYKKGVRAKRYYKSYLKTKNQIRSGVTQLAKN